MAHRQNVHHLFPVWHTPVHMIRKIHLRFSRFDKEAELFDRYGVLEQVKEVTWLGDQATGIHPFMLVPLQTTRSHNPSRRINPLKVENGMRFVKLPIVDPRTQNFLDKFLRERTPI